MTSSPRSPGFPALAVPQIGGVGWGGAIAGLVLLLCSSARHLLFKSGAFDLGIFDQAVYLISQGQPPIPTALGFHILGDHAAFILYPLALLYWIYPSVYWLLAVQAIALAGGVVPLWALARQGGVKSGTAGAIGVAYLLYPLVFNLNLFDFHPDVVALPGLLAAIWAARFKRRLVFCLSVLLVMSCKEVLALTVAAMGIWLWGWEQRRLYGTIALLSGLVWFWIATQGVIPHFGGAAATVSRHLTRYSQFGQSFPEIAVNLVLHPERILGPIVSVDTLSYLALLLLPIVWGVSRRSLPALVGALPTLAINILSDTAMQRDLVRQYSLPLLPFLLVGAIATLSQEQTGLAARLRSKRAIVLWSLLGFLSLAKFTYFGDRYLTTLDTWAATRAAIAQVTTPGSVLTTHEISPHLSHRSRIDFTRKTAPPDLSQFQYVLLDRQHPGWQSDRAFAAQLIQQLQATPEFEQKLEQDQIYLFVRQIVR
jgi:uncharacterized membrane protein